jgi:hypothetical protein
MTTDQAARNHPGRGAAVPRPPNSKPHPPHDASTSRWPLVRFHVVTSGFEGCRVTSLPAVVSAIACNRLKVGRLEKAKQASPSFRSMESPKWKPFSYLKAWVLKVNQVEPSVSKGAGVWFDLPKDKCVKRAAIFRKDLNDQLVLQASLIKRNDFCENRAHD